MDKINVFLVDDHEIFRNGVKQLVDNEEDLQVVGEASTGEDAISQLRDVEPDVIIMDIRMPGINGLETSKALLKNNPEAKILFFSLYDRDDYVASVLEMGGHGYILKDTSNKIFLHAIRTVHTGSYYFIGDVTNTIVKKYKELYNSIPSMLPLTTDLSLSKREQQILTMISNGLNNKDIADGLVISIRTIETHRLNIMRKFKVNGIEEALEMAKKAGLVE
jgi:DNA-binding NarL/FixJ family response regulator